MHGGIHSLAQRRTKGQISGVEINDSHCTGVDLCDTNLTHFASLLKSSLAFKKCARTRLALRYSVSA